MGVKVRHKQGRGNKISTPIWRAASRGEKGLHTLEWSTTRSVPDQQSFTTDISAETRDSHCAKALPNAASRDPPHSNHVRQALLISILQIIKPIGKGQHTVADQVASKW